MPDEFTLATQIQNAEFKAFSRHFEHPGEEDEPERRAVLFVFATGSFPDSGWRIRIEPVEGTDFEEWVLFEDSPGFRDGDRIYTAASGSSEHEIDRIPTTIRVRYSDKVERVSVVPWD